MERSLTMLQGQKMYKLLSLLIVLISCSPSEYVEETSSALEFEDNSRRIASKEDFSFAHRVVRSGDRVFIANKLLNIFGTSQLASSYIFDNIVSQQGVFGGGCDLYDRTYQGKDSLLNAWEGCFSAQENSPQIVSSNTLKEGYRIRACELLITHNEVSFDHAMTKAQVINADHITVDGLNRVYQLFYPTQALPDETAKIFFDYQEEFSTRELYRYSMLSFCLSEGWIIP